MKIDGITPAPTELAVESVTAKVSSIAPAAAEPPTATAGATTGDWTSFHSDSTSVLSLTSQVLRFPEVRQGTVDALRQSLSAGRYQVDPTKIAGAISSIAE